MDATGSMGGLLELAKNQVRFMFEEAQKILVDHKIDPKCFEL